MEYFVYIIKLKTFSMQKHLRKDTIHPIYITAGKNPKYFHYFGPVLYERKEDLYPLNLCISKIYVASFFSHYSSVKEEKDN